MKGSFYNRVTEGQQVGELHVGMGATAMFYSDREAYTVQKVISPKRVIVTRDKVERVDANGLSEEQEYRFEPVPIVEEAPRMACTNWMVEQLLHREGFACAYAYDHGTCEGCKWWKRVKPSNGVTLVLTKRGWKRAGSEVFFALGVKDEYEDPTF